MSYGLTPYDKRSYKESKRRRKQALRADKTGKIMPFSTARQRLIAIVSIIVAVALLVVAGVYIYKICNKSEITENMIEESVVSQSELLLVVNRQNPLSKEYVPNLKDFRGSKVNTIAYESLEQLFEKAESEGIELKIKSAYISFEEQNILYNNKLNEFIKNPDYTLVRAQATAQKYVPQAGCSEAQTGLLIDFDLSDVNTKAFIERHCVNYGFILRYPQDKEDITHLNPSETLYRYVGKDNAIKMRSYGMCLEEYKEYLDLQTM